jgi:heptosyltransferase-3
MKKIKRILISRTDNLGDVVLTFPMIGLLKRKYPDIQIYFLGKTYTKDLIELNNNLREFLNYDEITNKSTEEAVDFLKSFGFDAIIHVYPRKEIAFLAKKAQIRYRIGTSHRWYHWFTCNKLIHFSRKKSELHEAQLNIKLLKPLKIKKIPPLNELYNYYDLKRPELQDEEKIVEYYDKTLNIDSLVDKEKINLVFHPKSNGSAEEWGLDNFANLLDLLPEDKYKVFLTGTKAEGELLKEFSSLYADKLMDVTGIFNLKQFIYFLSKVDGIVAASTGPLHIAAALGKFAVGLYSPERPVFPQRWAPIGKNAFYVVNESCNVNEKENCVSTIPAERVYEIIKNYFKN